MALLIENQKNAVKKPQKGETMNEPKAQKTNGSGSKGDAPTPTFNNRNSTK